MSCGNPHETPCHDILHALVLFVDHEIEDQNQLMYATRSSKLNNPKKLNYKDVTVYLCQTKSMRLVKEKNQKLIDFQNICDRFGLIDNSNSI